MTTYTAFVQSVDGVEMDSNGILTMSLFVKFFENDDGDITLNEASVAIAWNPGGLLSTLNDAMTDAIVDYADTAWSWDVPRTRVVMLSFQKGLPI